MGRTYGSCCEDTVCHNQSTPNERDKSGSLILPIKAQPERIFFSVCLLFAVSHGDPYGMGTNASTRAHSSRILIGFDI